MKDIRVLDFRTKRHEGCQHTKEKGWPVWCGEPIVAIWRIHPKNVPVVGYIGVCEKHDKVMAERNESEEYIVHKDYDG